MPYLGALLHEYNLRPLLQRDSHPRSCTVSLCSEQHHLVCSRRYPRLSSLTRRCPQRGGLLLTMPSAGCADSAPHTLCKPSQLLPLFAQPAPLCLLSGITMEGDGLSAPGNGERQLQAASPRILHQDPNAILPGAQGATEQRTHYSTTQLPRARRIIYYHFLATERWNKAPALPRCHQQQPQLPHRDLCTSQHKVHWENLNPSLKKPSPHTT